MSKTQRVKDILIFVVLLMVLWKHFMIEREITQLYKVIDTQSKAIKDLANASMTNSKSIEKLAGL